MSPISEDSVRSARMLPPDTIISTRREGPSAGAVASPTRTLSARRSPSGWPTGRSARLAARFSPRARRGRAWRRLTYAAALDRTRRVAQALVDRRLSVDRPLVILSGNSIEHAVLALAAMYVGVPYAPVAPSYSLLSQDHRTLRRHLVRDAARPGLRRRRARASSVRWRACRRRRASRSSRARRCRDEPDDAVCRARRDGRRRARVDEAHARVGPDTVAKILFTSGSTGRPKGVINTHGMLSANQEQIRAVMAFLADEPPVLCDWLPWNHTFGGNHNFGLTLYNGGTLYLDAGTPAPTTFATTLANLREIATTAYFNVPNGYELLLPRASRAMRSSAGCSSAGCGCSSMPRPACGRRCPTSSSGWPSRRLRRTRAVGDGPGRHRERATCAVQRRRCRNRSRVASACPCPASS